MSPLRVVSLSPASTEIVCALGCGEWLVGRPAGCADPEAIAALRPDRIIVQEECSTLAGMWREFRRVAGLLGVPERGVQLVSRLAGRMRAIESRAGTLGARPRVAFIGCIEPLAGAGRWIPELVALAGGENLFGEPGAPEPRVGWGTLRSADPAVLWVAPRGCDLASARVGLDTVAARPGWSGLGAVRASQVFGADGHALFHRPGPRVMESLEALAEALHPEAFRFGHEGRGWERRVAGVTEGARLDP